MFSFFCLASQTPEGKEIRAYFIQIEREYRKQLELQFAQATQIIQQAHQNHLQFTYSLAQLHKVSGIVNKSQVKQSLVEYFKLNEDYVIVEKQMMMNEDTYHILVMSFRSAKGADIDKLPEELRIKTEAYFKFHNDKRKNRVVAKRLMIPEGQLSLFN